MSSEPTPSPSPPQGAGGTLRERVIATLERHRVPPAGAQACRDRGVALREATFRRKVEHGVLLDADTGGQVGGTVTGTAEQVDAEQLLRAMRPGRRYVFVHTHPLGYSFTPLDVAVLAAHWPQLCAVVAVGGQGVWYIASVLPGYSAPAPEDVRTAFRNELPGVAPAYQARVQAGELTRKEAQRQITHDVWERIAPDLDLRYDRVT